MICFFFVSGNRNPVILEEAYMCHATTVLSC